MQVAQNCQRYSAVYLLIFKKPTTNARIWEKKNQLGQREYFDQIWWKKFAYALNNRHALNKTCLVYMSFPATVSQSRFVY